jgi:acyl CoA:acetate/3-ketoacid CoA transferase beta subunit
VALTRAELAARVAWDLSGSQYVNLGIGLPTLVADYVSGRAYPWSCIRRTAFLVLVLTPMRRQSMQTLSTPGRKLSPCILARHTSILPLHSP